MARVSSMTLRGSYEAFKTRQFFTLVMLADAVLSCPGKGVTVLLVLAEWCVLLVHEDGDDTARDIIAGEAQTAPSALVLAGMTVRGVRDLRVSPDGLDGVYVEPLGLCNLACVCCHAELVHWIPLRLKWAK